MNIFVTGAGGPAGVNVIRNLVEHGHLVVAADCDPTAVGFHLAQRSELLPRADTAQFPMVLLDLLVAHEIDVIVSTIVEELMVLDGLRAELASIGVGHWGPSLSSLALCNDKLAFSRELERHGVTTPRTSAGFGLSVTGPWIVKPRSGRGSRDVHAVDTRRGVQAARSLTPDPLVQERVDGREFSADVLVADSGTVLGIATRWRETCRGGISTSGTTFSNPDVDLMVTKALTATSVSGPANVQGFVTTDGGVTIIEINPRFSGGLALSTAAGCELVEQHVRGATGLTVEQSALGCAAGVSMTRHFEEVIINADTAHRESRVMT